MQTHQAKLLTTQEVAERLAPTHPRVIAMKERLRRLGR